MDDLKQYLKYYDMEYCGYFDEIRRRFQEDPHHITPEDFLAIVIWKRNA
jgi:hypothetical protein